MTVRFFTIESMNGRKERDVNYPHIVFLSQSFLKATMKVKLSDWEDQISKIGQEIDIRCPICQQGCLQLHSIEKLDPPVKKVANSLTRGNLYKYSCSNPNCQGKFMGGVRFPAN